VSGEPYTYSGITMTAQPYPPVIKKISNQVTKFSGQHFNSVLLNRYRNGSDKIGWHSDNEKCLGEIINIATISLGAKRHLLTKRPGDKKSVELELEHGSLLLMKHPFQHKWLHCIPPRKLQNDERISLTFRTIVTAQDST
jgi:alkylated DNA repair dioxygenase AlkB